MIEEDAAVALRREVESQWTNRLRSHGGSMVVLYAAMNEDVRAALSAAIKSEPRKMADRFDDLRELALGKSDGKNQAWQSIAFAAKDVASFLRKWPHPSNNTHG